MGLKVGGADVTDVKLGATQVAKVMLGAVQVWPVAAPPPTGPRSYILQPYPTPCQAGGSGSYRYANDRVWLQLPDAPFNCDGGTFSDWVAGLTSLGEPFTQLTLSAAGHPDLVLTPADINGTQGSAFLCHAAKAWLKHVDPDPVTLTLEDSP